VTESGYLPRANLSAYVADKVADLGYADAERHGVLDVWKIQTTPVCPPAAYPGNYPTLCLRFRGFLWDVEIQQARFSAGLFSYEDALRHFLNPMSQK